MLIHTPAALAQFCRDRRKINGLSQDEVAREAALRQDTVSRFELGPDHARLDTLFRLLAALDLELHLLPKGPDAPAAQPSEWTEPW